MSIDTNDRGGSSSSTVGLVLGVLVWDTLKRGGRSPSRYINQSRLRIVLSPPSSRGFVPRESYPVPAAPHEVPMSGLYTCFRYCCVRKSMISPFGIHFLAWTAAATCPLIWLHRGSLRARWWVRSLAYRHPEDVFCDVLDQNYDVYSWLMFLLGCSVPFLLRDTLFHIILDDGSSCLRRDRLLRHQVLIQVGLASDAGAGRKSLPG